MKKHKFLLKYIPNLTEKELVIQANYMHPELETWHSFILSLDERNELRRVLGIDCERCEIEFSKGLSEEIDKLTEELSAHVGKHMSDNLVERVYTLENKCRFIQDELVKGHGDIITVLLKRVELLESWQSKVVGK